MKGRWLRAWEQLYEVCRSLTVVGSCATCRHRKTWNEVVEHYRWTLNLTEASKLVLVVGKYHISRVIPHGGIVTDVLSRVGHQGSNDRDLFYYVVHEKKIHEAEQNGCWSRYRSHELALVLGACKRARIKYLSVTQMVLVSGHSREFKRREFERREFKRRKSCRNQTGTVCQTG